MKENNTIEAFVLAGGKSTRMGTDKGLALLRGKPMISYILATLQKAELPVRIVANNNAYEVFGLKVYPDMVPGKGPMGGLFTAFEHTTADMVLLAGCDMPLIPVEMVERLLSDTGHDKIVAPVLLGQVNPLFALYPRSLKQKLEEYIASGRLKMTDFILENKHVLLPPVAEEKPWCFQNINDLSQLREVEEKWGDLS
ncbi:molybdenum cofactor guanylyltransferase [Sinomicrobium weinanense]|uniref:Probable molybdenum cofactor guanylyltransferase n=1 Tax=Sinomicrobium weinanense TaxID=2842200 RepID=A0A926JUP9_9FLAO|nr:molybdenum cofactor guanylyltransferase [Sinomicrobium weinanense]MBC9797701.1 molybdenum cofactor guanylyltransferase [Sinomicrobium weinanense]MBU3122273.1 molybdenum cofactor guanylyltransferase [Sinomicrobium weinanense]